MALIVGHGKINNPTRLAFPEGTLAVQYHNAYSEIGGRGLEGLATKTDIADEKTLRVVAVAVWEGGFPESSRMPCQLGRPRVQCNLSQPPHQLQNKEFKPTIISTIISTSRERVGGSKVTVQTLGDEIQVEVPKPADKQTWPVFRAPDLVWAIPSNAVREAGSTGHDAEFILLISSERSPAAVCSPNGCPPEEQFRYTCLWEVTKQGTPTGRSLDIKHILEANELRHLKQYANWEGLAWYGADQLILVNDNENKPGSPTHKQVPLTALIVQGPDKWNQGKACY